MRRLVYICDWLPPDFGAVGQYSLLFSREHARNRTDVVLIGLTSHERRIETEMLAGGGSLTIARLPAPRVDRQRLGRRLLWTLRMNLRLLRAARRYARRGDEVLFTGSPPFLLHFFLPASFVLGWRLTYRITDFHPECLLASLSRAPLALRAFYKLTCLLRRRVHRYEALGEDQIERLREIGIPRSRITLKRDPAPVPVNPRAMPLDRPRELDDWTTLLYSGNYGVAHDVETFVQGFIEHHRVGNASVGLWLNAVGANAEVVEARLKEEGLPVVRTNLVPLEDVPRLLVAADCHLITLKERYWGFVLPSKIYGCVDSGRDVLFVGPRQSDVHLICGGHLGMDQRYFQADCGDPAGVRAALDVLGARRPSSATEKTGKLGTFHEVAQNGL